MLDLNFIVPGESSRRILASAKVPYTQRPTP